MHEGLRDGLRRQCRYRLRRLLRPSIIQSNGIRVAIDYDNWSRDMILAVLSDMYELPERRIAAASINQGDRVLEIGGGIGVVGVQAALACGNDPCPVIYEANLALIPTIKKTMELNSVTAEVIWGAVVANDHAGDEAIFHVSRQFWSSSLIEKDSEIRQERVPAYRIGDLIQKYNPDVLIMDVEGAEKYLLPSIELASVRVLCIEFHSRYIGRKEVNSLIRLMVSSGFDIDFGISDMEVIAFLR